MKTSVYRSGSRGRADHGWLKSAFSYSFADYFDRNRMGLGALRVFNDDIIAPSSGFPMHPHDNMEIVTIVTEGAVEHKDSIGSGSVIRPGEAQRMSAGRGILHSEWNPSGDETLKLFQIWIKTRDRDIAPEYEQAVFDFEKNRGRLVTVVSGDPDEEGLTFHQDAWIMRGLLSEGQSVEYKVKREGNALYLFVVNGAVTLNGEKLESRDAAEIENADSVKLLSEADSDIILIEVSV